MEIGVFTFADVSPDPGGAHAGQRFPELIEEIELADQVGLDVFGIGEHQRPDFAAPAPPILLAAAASRTSRIRLTSSVTVLGSEDPVRVMEQFSMLDALSGGRAEITAGRGSFVETFGLFGYDLNDYDELFAEKLDLLLALRSGRPVTWSGRYRAPLVDVQVHPTPVQQPIPVSLAVGGSPGSFVRAGRLGLPLALGIVGGSPARAEFDRKILPDGPYLVGSPDQVVDKILLQHRIFGQQRTLFQLAIGSVGHADLMAAIELLGTEVGPAVRAELGSGMETPATSSAGR